MLSFRCCKLAKGVWFGLVWFGFARSGRSGVVDVSARWSRNRLLSAEASAAVGVRGGGLVLTAGTSSWWCRWGMCVCERRGMVGGCCF